MSDNGGPVNHGEEPLESGTVSNACTNPECQANVIRHEMIDAIETKAQLDVWRAGNAVDRARALRVLASAVLYSTALFHIIFSPDMWARLGAVIMVMLCFQAMHKEG